MNQAVEKAANEAIFQLQLKSRDAVRYVQRNASTKDAVIDHKVAADAIKKTVTFHRAH